MGVETVAAAALGSAAIGDYQETRSQQQANRATMNTAANNQKMQYDRDLANYELDKKFSEQEKAYRDQLLKMMTEGYTDNATGVSTKYIPGQGTVTNYSPEANQRVQGENRENLLRVIQDAAMSRRGRQDNELRRQEEGATADQVLSELRSPDPYDSKRIIADIISSRRRGVNEGFDRTQREQITSDIRTGTGSNAMLVELAKARSNSLRDAEAGGYTEGLGVAEELRGARTSRIGNLYNVLASRASNQDDVAFSPQTLTSNAQNAAMARNPASAGSAQVGGTNIQPNAEGYDLNAIKANPSMFTSYGRSLNAGSGYIDPNRTRK